MENIGKRKGGIFGMEKYCFGVDVGGTTIKLGLFTVEGELLEKRGKYYELYEIQSAYYRGNPTGEEGGLGYEEVEPV